MMSYVNEYIMIWVFSLLRKALSKWMDLEGIILSEVTQSQNNSHDMYSLISGYYPRNLEYPRYKIQSTGNSRRTKTKVWTLCPFLELGTKHQWEELQRQSLELRKKDGLSRDCHLQGSIA